MLSIKVDQGAPDLAAWEKFQALLEKLDVNGMSSEDEDVEKLGHMNVTVFRVRLCAWRAPEIGEYLKYIDKEGENPAVRGTRGTRSYPRIKIDEDGRSPPPPGLPRTLYNPTWLAQQERTRSRWVQDELQVSAEIFELLTVVRFESP